MKERIRQRASELGFDQCRFTTALPPEHAEALEAWFSAGLHGEMEYLRRNSAKRKDPQLVLPGARSIIVLAVSYASGEALLAAGSAPAREIPARAEATPRGEREAKPLPTGVVARYARYADYHHVLGPQLKELTAFIHGLAAPGTRSLWYVDTGPVLERDFAQRAGLGFIGKHTNLISRELGNWFFLAEIVTTLELEPDAAEKNRCGTCSRCLTACPTGAIQAPYLLDARRCISYLTIELKGAIPEELRPALGNRIYGCDDCLAVCPWNRFAQEGRLMLAHAKPGLGAADLIQLLSLTEDGFKARFQGSPILRTKRRGLLRNVCVALGNTGDGSALPALQKAVADPEPLVAEHAQWAIEQIERRLSPR